jgi:exodeoxyribonuclease VII large subunit
MAEDPVPPKRTIRQINKFVQAIVERETGNEQVIVDGLVKRIFVSDRGHLYFDLYDENYQIRCMVPDKIRHTLGISLTAHQEVRVFGTIRVYDVRAEVQIEVENLEPIEPQPRESDAAVLDKLKADQLWPKQKKPLPPQIRAIGLVTSKQSEALHDFDHEYRKALLDEQRQPAAVKLIDVPLQGSQAPRHIADAIERFSQDQEIDVIVLARGGGRDAELAVFNDYLIVEAICRSQKPVVTGIGHQRNETTADIVADLQLSTPAIAAVSLAQHNPIIATTDAPALPTAKTPDYRLAALILLCMVGILAAVLIAVLISTAR